MEQTRQKKISALLQKDFIEIFQAAIRDKGIKNLVVSVSTVRVTPDLGNAKVFISVFPYAQAASFVNEVQTNKTLFRHELALRVKNQLRKVPEIDFYLDDALEHIENIDRALSSKENPLQDSGK